MCSNGGFRFARSALLCALLAAAPCRAAPAEIPFVLEGHRIVVEAGARPERRPAFGVDTGLSNGMVVTPAAARTLGVKAQGDAGVSDATGKRVQARRGTLPELRLGAATLHEVPVAISEVPKAVLERPHGGSLSGYIGAPLLDGAVLCVDYGRQRLLRWDRGEFSADRQEAVPLQRVHGLPTVRVDIDGRTATLIVDTGAEPALTIYTSFAERNDFAQRYPALAAGAGNGGNGRAFQSVLTVAKTLGIGPGAEFNDVPMQVIPQGFDPAWGIDGALGFPILRELEPCLDVEGERLLYKAV